MPHLPLSTVTDDADPDVGYGGGHLRVGGCVAAVQVVIAVFHRLLVTDMGQSVRKGFVARKVISREINHCIPTVGGGTGLIIRLVRAVYLVLVDLLHSH